MSSTPGGSGSSNPPSNPPKAIASLAKRQSDVTRGGAAKLKFVPTLPARRKKDEVKQEEALPAVSQTPDRGRGRGRGVDRGRGGRGRGGGEGKGAAPRPPPVEMTASGPFALGPTLAGTSARRTAPKTNFTPIVPQGPNGAVHFGAGLSATAVPTIGLKRENILKKADEEKGKREEDAEVYSDPDEGVEIVDMENVKNMDYMAPESLRKEKELKRKKLKKEDPDKIDIKGKAREGIMDVDRTLDAEGVNLANAVDLSESGEEEELEDIIDDFASALDMRVDESIHQERLFFFQFPNPLPQFVSNTPAAGEESKREESMTESSKKVTFSEDTKPPAAPSPETSMQANLQEKKEQAVKEEPKVDGLIGQLEVYASGAVKMRLANGILMDVTAATQPSFLQHAVHVDPTNKRLCVLGEVGRKFVVSPDIDTLLASMLPSEPLEGLNTDGLFMMDTT